MNLNFLILFVISCLIYACSGSKEINKYYSKSGYSYEETKSKYKNVRIHSGKKIEVFIDSLAYIKNKDIPDNINVSGNVYCQPLIDEAGYVESILCLKTLHPYLDSLTIEAIKNTKYKPLVNSNGIITKYSLLFKFEFVDGAPLYPSINNASTVSFVQAYKKKQEKIKREKEQRNNIKVEYEHKRYPGYYFNVLNTKQTSFIRKYLHDITFILDEIIYNMEVDLFEDFEKFDCKFKIKINKSGKLMNLEQYSEANTSCSDSLKNLFSSQIRSVFPFKSFPETIDLESVEIIIGITTDMQKHIMP